MGTNHKIVVEFARSIKRKIDVHIKSLNVMRYEYTNFKKYTARLVPKREAANFNLLKTVVITVVVLIIITGVIMLSLDG